MRRVFLFVVLAVSVSVWADTTVYKRVRPDGTVEFSDSPLPGGTAVELPEITTVPATKTPPSSRPQPTESSRPTAPIVYEAVRVTAPAAEETVFFDENGLPIMVEVRPALQPDHKIAVYLDGQQVAAGAQSSFSIKGVFRGTHTVSAAVLNGQGETVLRSAPVTFHLIQHTRRP